MTTEPKLRAFAPSMLSGMKIVNVSYNNKDKDTEKKKRRTITLVLEGSEEHVEKTQKKVESSSQGATKEETKKDNSSPKLGVSLIPSQRDEDLISCDGACGKQYHPNNLHSMGRCDHYICKFCFDLVGNSDGSVGCSAINCVKGNFFSWMEDPKADINYEVNILPKERGREKSSREGHGPVLDETPSLCNMLNVKTTKSWSTAHKVVSDKTKKSSTSEPKKTSNTSSRSDLIISEASLSTAVRVHAYVFNKSLNNVEVEKVFRGNSTMKRVALKIARKAFPDFCPEEGLRVFYSSSKSMEPVYHLSAEELETTVVSALQSKKRTLFILIEQSGGEE